MSLPWTSVNGVTTRAADARISIFDRGLLYGDAIYTTVKVVDGRLLFWERHLDRLRDAFGALRFPPSALEIDFRALALRVVDANERDDCAVRITVTRGVADEAGPPGVTHVVTAWLPAPRRPFLDAITVPESRDALRFVKTASRVTATLARMAAGEAGADEAIFTVDQSLVEATCHNLIAVENGALCTPPLAAVGLPGIARAVLAARLALDEARVPATTEGPVYLTNTLHGPIPLRRLDGRVLGRDDALEARLVAEWTAAELDDGAVSGGERGAARSLRGAARAGDPCRRSHRAR
jgi:branched-subunit amino acid aminotransferase/4-amino-4-deoxychorismate lyase